MRCNPRRHIPRPPYTCCSKSLCYGIILFIVSEVFFWVFYHSSLVPTHDLEGCWPTIGTTPLNPLEVTLLNTSVLLASGVSITWAYHSLTKEKRNSINQALLITILLPLVEFTILQASKYSETSFSISDEIYRSTYFHSNTLPQTTRNHQIYLSHYVTFNN